MVPKLEPYINEGLGLLKRLSRNLDPNFVLLMCNIVSLYTNTPHKLGLGALVYYFAKYRNLIPIRFSKTFIWGSWVCVGK